MSATQTFILRFSAVKTRIYRMSQLLSVAASTRLTDTVTLKFEWSELGWPILTLSTPNSDV